MPARPGSKATVISLLSGIAAATALGVGFGLGLSFSTVATSTYVSDVTAEENLGASMGALSSIMDMGHSAGPLVVGVAIQATTMGTGFLVGFGVCLASALAFAALNLGSRKAAASSARPRRARGDREEAPCATPTPAPDARPPSSPEPPRP